MVGLIAKNKKGRGIFPKEMIAVGFFIILGIGLWLIYSSTKGWLMETFAMSEQTTFFIGIIIVGVMLFFIKYKFPFKFG